MLTTVDLSRKMSIPRPWGSCYGLARSLIAFGTLLTLLFSSSETLFRPVRTVGDAPFCNGISKAGAFCVVPAGGIGLVQWICVGVLVVVIIGWRPRLSGIPHWYISFSVMANIAIPDGGDQIAGILTLLLIPVTIGDPRRWHWTSQHFGQSDEKKPSAAATALGLCAMIAIQIQVAGIYLNSSLAKLGVPEWVDGTALYYWIHNPSFGAPPYLRGLAYAAVDHPLPLIMLTWGPMVLEFALALALFFPRRAKTWMLVLGITFHLGIAVMMGLWSFAFVVFGALILYLSPIGSDAALVSRVRSTLPRRASTRPRGTIGSVADPALCPEKVSNAPSR